MERFFIDKYKSYDWSGLFKSFEKDIERFTEKNDEFVHNESDNENIYDDIQTDTDSFTFKYDGRSKFNRTCSSSFEYEKYDSTFMDAMQLIILEYDRIKNRTINLMKRKKKPEQNTISDIIKTQNSILQQKLIKYSIHHSNNFKDVDKYEKYIQENERREKCSTFCSGSKSKTFIYKCRSKGRKYHSENYVNVSHYKDMNRKVDKIFRIAETDGHDKKLAMMFVNVITRIKNDRSFKKIVKKSPIIAYFLQRTITTLWRLFTTKWDFYSDAELYEALFFLTKILGDPSKDHFMVLLRNKIVQQIKEQRVLRKLVHSKNDEDILKQTENILKIRDMNDKKLKMFAENLF